MLYEKNAADYIAQLEKLHEDITEKMNEIPKERESLFRVKVHLNTFQLLMDLKPIIFGRSIHIIKEHRIS